MHLYENTLSESDTVMTDLFTAAIRNYLDFVFQ